MKKSGRMIIVAFIAVALAAAWGLYPASVYAMSVQDLDNTWGKPVMTVKTDSGLEKRYYKLGNTMSDMGYRVFSIKGDAVTDEGLSGSLPVITTPVIPGLPVMAVSRDYWANHPTQADSLGKPNSTRHLPDGSMELFFKYEGASDIGNRYYLVKDGRVVASGTTARALTDPQAVEQKATRTIEASESYYKNNPMTLEQVEATWGQPVLVRKLSNGVEERLYRFQNTLSLGFRFFLIKDGKVIASGTEG